MLVFAVLSITGEDEPIAGMDGVCFSGVGFLRHGSSEGRQAVDCLLREGLTPDPSNKGGAVCCACVGVAADPSCLAGGDVRGEAVAGGVALSHAVLCVLWLL